MKRKNNQQELKNLNKDIKKSRFIMLIPLIVCIALLFCHAISFTGYYSIKVETKDSKNEYILDFGDDASQGISLFDIIIGNDKISSISGVLTIDNNTAKAETKEVPIICPTIPGMAIYVIMLVVGLILAVVPIFKCSKANMIQICVSVLLVVVSLVLLTAELNELLPEYLEMSRLSSLQVAISVIDHKDMTSNANAVVSYQYILLGISAAIQVVLAVSMLFDYRRKAKLENK